MRPERAPPAGPGPRRGWRPWWIGLALWLVLIAAAAVAVWHLRVEALQAETHDLELLSLALTDEVDRGLQGAEAGLRAMQSELDIGDLPVAGLAAVRALRTRAELMPVVDYLWLLDRSGRLMVAGDRMPLPALQGFSPPLADLRGDEIAVSRPFPGPAHGEPLVALAMRFGAGAGYASDPVAGPAHHSGAGGWIVAGLPARSLLGAFIVAGPAGGARMAVFRSDGVLLAGHIVASPTLEEPALAARLAVQPGMQLRRFRDGSDHLVSFNRLPHFGLGVMLTRSLDTALRAWRQTLQLTLAGAAVLGAVIGLAVWVVQRANRRRAEAQRALALQSTRATKLESLGTLAGGVAHDFNNLLASIMGFGEMAQDAAAPGTAQARHLDRVLQAAHRGKALVERILAFGRGAAKSAVVFELQPVVEDVLGLLAASLRPGLVLERALEAAGARVRGDPTQAFEAVMNLCANGLQAMPAGGRLTVRLTRAQVGAQRVLSHSVLGRGDWLVLCVGDQGGGITPAVMERLFEPFFTTRAKEQGTGLGLAVVHGVVAEFGGAIDVRSQPGRGAEFVLYLPESHAALDRVAAPSQAVPGGQGQALLVVDDDPELVALALELLAGLGYAPVGVSDPRQALAMLREAPDRFAALITDELMPGLGGAELTREVRAIRPGLPVLLVSGYGGAQLAQRAARAEVDRMLAKPLARASLAQALADVLAAERRGPATRIPARPTAASPD